jgi:DNA repair ATPase RecN
VDPNIERIEKKLKKDERYKRLKEMFSTYPEYRLNFDDLMAELKVLHKGRKILSVPNPNAGDFVKKLTEAAQHDHMFRSRIAEILVECSSVRSKLNKSLDAVTKHILHTYSTDLKSFRTKEERMNLVSTLLNKFYSYLYSVENIVDMCKVYIDNIDKGSYMVRELVQMHTTIAKFER